MLDDLADLFAEVRAVFCAHNQPFLHFHLLAGSRRRADVKGHANWVQLDLPRPVTATRRRALVRELRTRYSERAETKSHVRRRSPNYTLQRTGARYARPGH